MLYGVKRGGYKAIGAVLAPCLDNIADGKKNRWHRNAI